MSKFVAAFTLLVFGTGVATAQEFKAVIKKVEGNKVTINRSDKDNKFKDEVLVVSEKVKVTRTHLTLEDDGNGNFTIGMVDVEVKDGLKNNAFSKEVKVRITTDKKNVITDIRLGGGLFDLLDIPDLDIPDLRIEIPELKIEIPRR